MCRSTCEFVCARAGRGDVDPDSVVMVDNRPKWSWLMPIPMPILSPPPSSLGPKLYYYNSAAYLLVEDASVDRPCILLVFGVLACNFHDKGCKLTQKHACVYRRASWRTTREVSLLVRSRRLLVIPHPATTSPFEPILTMRLPTAVYCFESSIT